MAKITNSDQLALEKILDWKIPQDKLQKVLREIYSYSDLVDHSESPYTRPTFAKVSLLVWLIFTFYVFVMSPIITLMWNWTNNQELVEEIQEWVPTNLQFKFKLKLDKDIDWNTIVLLYDSNWKNILAKSNLNWDEADLLSTSIWDYTLNSKEVEIIKAAQSDFTKTESVKQDIISTLWKNISVNDTYLDFKNIDFWVDTVINTR
jgi:hypothetical protein